MGFENAWTLVKTKQKVESGPHQVEFLRSERNGLHGGKGLSLLCSEIMS